MVAQKYILNLLESLVVNFPKIRCRYEYNEIANCHMVEITPSEILQSDSEFAFGQMNTIDSFTERFPDDSVLFFAEDANDIIRIENPESATVIDGILFEETSSLLELQKSLEEMSNEHNFAVNIGGLFDKHRGEFPKKLHQTIKEHDAFSCTDPTCSYHAKAGRALQNVNIDKLVGRFAVVENIMENKTVLLA